MAKLTTSAREHIAGKNFALPGRRDPIEDASHARNALSRVSQFGSPAEKSEARAKVHAKYPGMGKEARHHGLTIASARHLHSAGHLTSAQKAHIEAKARTDLKRLRSKSNEPMPFGSLAPDAGDGQ